MKRLLFLLAVPAFAAPPGALPPGAVAPEDLPYTNNIVQNPSFERGFATNAEKGWKDDTIRGMDVDVESCPRNKPESAVDGKKALWFHVKKTVNYTYGELNGPFDKFRKAGNDGDGPPYGFVEQVAPVRPGARYALRFRWRSSGLYNQGAPGRDRGEVYATFRGEWLDKRGERIAADSAFPPPRWHKFQKDPKEPGWMTYTEPDFAELAARQKPVQYLVPPPGAVSVRFVFDFVCRREKVKPEFWVDQFEFAEQPEHPVFPEGKPPAKPAAQPAAPVAQPAAQPAAPGAQPAPQPAAPGAPPAKPAASAAPATEAKEGGVLKFRDFPGVEFHPYLALAGWKGSATREKPDPGAPAGTFSYRAGDVRIRAFSAFKAAADGSLRASWRFKPEAEADLAMLGIVLHLPADAFKGGSVRFDSASVELPQEPREKPWYYSGNASAVSVRGPDGKELFSFAFDAPARLALQDNRFWKGSVYELRILPPNPSPYPAGVELPFSLSLRGAAR